MADVDVEQDSTEGILLDIYERNGELTADLVVKEAEESSHPLHDRFEWDDADAGHQYRLWQARVLIQKVKITVEVMPETRVSVTEVKELIATRGFLHIRSRNTYAPTREILQDPDDRAEVIAEVLKQLRALRQKHAALTELSEIWNLIDGQA
jgi:hypothetical protein